MSHAAPMSAHECFSERRSMTEKQRTVRELILQGLSRSQMAKLTGLSERAVATHIERVLDIEGASSMRELQAHEIDRLRGQMTIVQWRAA